MLGAAVPLSAPPQDRLAEWRERFLTGGKVDSGQVRDTILASWFRSKAWRVPADHIELTYEPDFEVDTPLTRGALPVLRNLYESLDDQRISIVLSDSCGVVLSRMTQNTDFERRLDRILLVPGFSFAERAVGTNGIGTALEGGRPTQVSGHEHYAENLEDLACAAAPIRHPLTGKTLGTVDLTCPWVDATPLLLTLAKTTASQIQHALAAESSPGAFELFEEYLRTCKRTAGIVLAVGDDLAVMNDYARHALDAGDQAALLGRAREGIADPHARPDVVTLSRGSSARLYWHPVQQGGRLTGAVMQVKLTDEASPRRSARAGQALPGLGGSAPLWLQACADAEAGYLSGQWLALTGEAGVGKLALLRALHQKHEPATRFRVISADELAGPAPAVRLRDVLLDGAGGVVALTHLERLTPAEASAAAEALQAARDQAPDASATYRLWVAATWLTGAGEESATAMQYFPKVIPLPPLRHRIDDVRELVPLFLRRVNRPEVSVSGSALQLLMRSNWPGNCGQLWQVISEIVRLKRAGVVQPADLPPECQTVSRRILNPLESMERDAIVRSLTQSHGRKGEAARALGMSRATIYRRIREYGILIPELRSATGEPVGSGREQSRVHQLSRPARPSSGRRPPEPPQSA